MAVISEGDHTVRTDGSHLERTFAMSLVAAGYAIVLAGLVYFVVAIALPIAGEPGAPPIPIFLFFIVIVAVSAALSAFWSGARRRPWFWLVITVPALLIIAGNVPFIVQDIVRPANTEAFLFTIFMLAAQVAAIAGGITAFREVRLGGPIWSRTGRAGWVTIAVVGALLGAAMTGVAAGATLGGGSTVAGAPTVTGVLTAENTAFIETSLQVQDGEVLGLFIVNKDDIGHTFEIDSLEIHVELPPNSTTGLAVKPPGPGSLEFFCGISGHREAGMVGTITVDA
ncbi:MAG TPA: cupredoxin domain-containing protein [Acidimicrobiia bacterium]